MRALAAALAVAWSTASAADVAPTALRLGDAASPQLYELRLAIDPAEPGFTGEVRITLLVNRETDVIWLNAKDLDIEQATFVQGEKPIEVRVQRAGDDRVGFEAVGDKFVFGTTTAAIRYRGKLEPSATHGLFHVSEGGKPYVMSQFEAIDARRAIPSFDEPGWKTPWDITIDAPAADAAVSNAAEAAAEDIADRPGWRRHRFARTKPLPTYLVALAVGPFATADGGTAGEGRTPLRFVAPEGRAAEARFARSATPRVLQLLEAYFGTPFPFGKLDSVAIPGTTRFGAMENAGMITYDSRLLLATAREESPEFQRGYVSVGAHEMAHQWFGDLVTLAWWDDVWLNEAFATWMARKTVRQFRPEWESGWRHGEQRRRALQADHLLSARQVRNAVVDKNDIYGGFDGITYSKGAEVLSMFESWLGEAPFRQGVRNYLSRHAGGNATTEDFFRAVGEAGGRGEQAAAALRSFVEQPGLPLVDVSLACGGGRLPALKVAQRRFAAAGHTAPPQRWMTPACFRYRSEGKLAKQCTEVTSDATIPLGVATCPDWIVGNADGAGHWIARYDAPLLGKLANAVVDLPEDEAVAFAGDMTLLVGSGLVSRDEGLRFANSLLRHPALGVRHGGMYFLERQRDEVLSAAQRQARQALLVSYVFPMARSFGWLDHAADDLGTRELRALVMAYAARMPGGERFRARANDLAMRWIDNPEALPASSVAAVLVTTGRFADTATFDRLAGALARTQGARDRSRLIAALAAARDPSLRARALDMALRDPSSGGLDPHESFGLLQDALRDDANRAPAFAFLREHWDGILKKIPSESGGWLLEPLGGLCSRRDRQDFAAFFQQRAQDLHDGPRRYAQALEQIDICLASSSAGERAAPVIKRKAPRRGRRG
ncbi:MAG TPA: M1 family metallopeptidase [Usitatibacter sp.]|nr:M1 family metallopeptidase [Usitatibacter sp.]